jgi:hypothetical protein
VGLFQRVFNVRLKSLDFDTKALGVLSKVLRKKDKKSERFQGKANLTVLVKHVWNFQVLVSS